jgi:hypothetical protein
MDFSLSSSGSFICFGSWTGKNEKNRNRNRKIKRKPSNTEYSVSKGFSWPYIFD